MVRSPPRVIIVDNYDSFTFNLVQLLGSLGAGCEVFLNDRCNPATIAERDPAAIVLSPGPGRPEQAGACLSVLRAFAGRVPILGVCLGHQAIALHFGGTIVVDPRPRHGKQAHVFHDGKSLYRGASSPFLAGTYNSLLVDGDSLPPTLDVSAQDDEGRLMGLRARTPIPTEGIQFHPESILSDCGPLLMRNWLNCALV